MPLIAVPNVSEGRDGATIDEIGAAFASTGARVLDVHSDADHHRSVYTLAAPPGRLWRALVAGAREAMAGIDLRTPRGSHPHVGVLDVAPVVHLDEERRGAACAEALVAADELGRLGLPVYLYGALAGGRTRAELRKAGPEGLHAIPSDFGPPGPHITAGATLVAARPPLIAFNVELAPPATIVEARLIAGRLREGGEEGLPGVRALGLSLPARRNVAQVSFNVEDHLAVPLARLVEAVARHAPIAEAEVVGLPPRAAFTGYPDDLPTRNRRTLEELLDS